MKGMAQLLLVLLALTIANLPLSRLLTAAKSPGLSRTPIETELWFQGRPVRLILPKNFNQGHDPDPVDFHLHGSVPFEDVPDLELNNSGYRDLPGKYRVMVAAPRAALDPLGFFTWNSFFSQVGCGPVHADDIGFLNELLDKLLEDYPIDPQRVYIYGYSAGAAMRTAWRATTPSGSQASWQVPGLHWVIHILCAVRSHFGAPVSQ